MSIYLESLSLDRLGYKSRVKLRSIKEFCRLMQTAGFYIKEDGFNKENFIKEKEKARVEKLCIAYKHKFENFTKEYMENGFSTKFSDLHEEAKKIEINIFHVVVPYLACYDCYGAFNGAVIKNSLVYFLKTLIAIEQDKQECDFRCMSNFKHVKHMLATLFSKICIYTRVRI